MWKPGDRVPQRTRGGPSPLAKSPLTGSRWKFVQQVTSPWRAPAECETGLASLAKSSLKTTTGKILGGLEPFPSPSLNASLPAFLPGVGQKSSDIWAEKQRDLGRKVAMFGPATLRLLALPEPGRLVVFTQNGAALAICSGSEAGSYSRSRPSLPPSHPVQPRRAFNTVCFTPVFVSHHT